MIGPFQNNRPKLPPRRPQPGAPAHQLPTMPPGRPDAPSGADIIVGGGQLLEAIRFLDGDRNRDGKMSRDEFKAAAMVGRSAADGLAADLAFDHADANGDGKLSMEEATSARVFELAKKLVPIFDQIWTRLRVR